ncbi:MAG: polysaccharide deacetylase family protein [Desulfitobacteriaceae bacterium]|nr:polysaccharide deacetylase family protein [Desulfitobacteriaceae bacterium]MDD4345718.1 polysaccharide deacetylase family protein [Desulfitobacteriaceae bacterium]MDD4400424.1 polysaccharide deacetylase family protein [Desulfitobacteriaceae bacterium]
MDSSLQCGFSLILLVSFIFGLAAYTVIPDLFLHRLGIGSWKRQYTPGVALTFDDGPDPEYTPRILEVLARNNVRAAFFLVGSKAVAFPWLTKEILAQGHQLGLHSLNHRYAWFSAPWTTWREWEAAAGEVEKIAGRQVNWVRPPWGTFNLATWLWVKKRCKRIVLWNNEGHDWQVRYSADQIAQRIVKRAKPGGIIVLHDSGSEAGVRENTLQALEIICQQLKSKKKLSLVPLEFPDWNGLRRLSFGLWQKWEELFAGIYHLEKIDSTNLFRLTKTRYKGPELYDKGGQVIAKEGDLVAELHIDSLRLSGKGTDIHTVGIRTLRQTRESLPELAAYINNNPAYSGIQVIMGISLLNRGVKGFGFHVQEVSPNWLYRWIEILQKLNSRIYQPVRKAGRSKQLASRPKLVWISKEELFSRWLRET